MHKVLGQTYGLLVIQDFEAVSPNLLCRTIETVKGGGSVVFLIDKLDNLKMLYTLKLEVHSRYRPTQSGLAYEPRFTERFLLSLNNCKDIMVVDDELNVLPIFKYINEIKCEESKTISLSNKDSHLTAEQKLLKKWIKDTTDTPVVHAILQLCKTSDQCSAVNSLIVHFSEFKKSPCIKNISVTSGRGRGKTCSIGLSVAAALHMGYKNILVSAPSPENIQSMWDMIITGLNSLKYKEFDDYVVKRIKSNLDSHHDSNRNQIDSIVQISMVKTKQ